MCSKEKKSWIKKIELNWYWNWDWIVYRPDTCDVLFEAADGEKAVPVGRGPVDVCVRVLDQLLDDGEQASVAGTAQAGVPGVKSKSWLIAR